MTSLSIDSQKAGYNPLDVAEQIMLDRDWAYDRPSDEELIAEVVSSHCNYRVWFTWQEELEALIFCCALDAKIARPLRTRIYPLLAQVNEKLWLGHFDLSGEEGIITFRHTVLLRGGGNFSSEQVQDLVDIAVNECERFYPALQSVMWGGKSVDDALRYAMFETLGEA